MMMKTPSDSRRLAAADAPRPRRIGRTADWLLSVVFAGLLGTAVWKLDHASPTIDEASRAATASTWTGRLGAVARSMLETLIVRDVAQGGLGAGQVPAEGWPLWSGEPGDRAVSSGCRRDGLPSRGPARCD